ncbi:SRPBCC family protein [Spirosoma spitsbergense]|uniref:SRPBCC family protein n=1 Tax=Spirosoma spitsbergense TaxID=431554 RepID=UPI001FE0E007|nr:SRPBCC family protein [Spirosoma spitsbergense]
MSILLLTSGLPVHAQQTNVHFSHTLETRALPEKIWQLWTDVPNWKDWDDGLKSAALTGPFQQGAIGMLTPDKGPTSKFVVDSLVPDQSYTIKTKLPFGSLYVKRYLTVEEGKTQFTHEVWFSGLTKGLFARVLGKHYRTILPDVMRRISVLAENR